LISLFNKVGNRKRLPALVILTASLQPVARTHAQKSRSDG
jgi:hypothetical protein